MVPCVQLCAREAKCRSQYKTPVNRFQIDLLFLLFTMLKHEEDAYFHVVSVMNFLQFIYVFFLTLMTWMIVDSYLR